MPETSCGRARWGRWPAAAASAIYAAVAAFYFGSNLAAESTSGTVLVLFILAYFLSSSVFTSTAAMRSGNMISLFGSKTRKTIDAKDVVAVKSTFLSLHVYHMEDSKIHLTSAKTFLWQIVLMRDLNKIFDNRGAVVEVNYLGWPSTRISRAIQIASGGKIKFKPTKE